jgi:hypothetical protein
MPMIGQGPLDEFCEFYGVRAGEDAMRAACERARSLVGQNRAPIALTPIARALAARVQWTDRGAGGALSMHADHWVISLARRAHWRRARFTLAHELAHILLFEAVDPGWVTHLEDPSLLETVERLCDLGAAELLAPRELVHETLRADGLTPAGLERVYDEFLVSWPAVFSSLARTYAPANVSIWRPGVRQGDGERMRVVRSFGSKDHYWVPPGIGESHLSRLMAYAAAMHDTAASADVCLEYWPYSKVLALATRMPDRRRHRDQLPVWQGVTVRDEPGESDQIVVLLLSPESTAAFADLQGDRAPVQPGGTGAIGARVAA